MEKVEAFFGIKDKSPNQSSNSLTPTTTNNSILLSSSPTSPSGSSPASIIFNDIITRLQATISNPVGTKLRDTLAAIHKITPNSSARFEPTIQDFQSFCNKIHDWLISGDSSTRAVLLRIIRMCMISEDHCRIIILEEIHWIIVISLETTVVLNINNPNLTRDNVIERMQALKIVKKFIIVAKDIFPKAFVRSLVSCSNAVDDTLRRVCLESLREVAVILPDMVAAVNGLSSLLDAVLDPSTGDMAESILVTFLYLLNDQKTRKHIRPYLDFRYLLSPFTDFDTEKEKIVEKWKAAKTAFIIIMRSWIGVIQLTEDNLGLTTLISLLKDPNMSTELHEVILESISELFQPLKSKSSMSSNHTKKKNSGKKFNKTVTPLPTPGESIEGYDKNFRQSLSYVSNKEIDRNTSVNRDSRDSASNNVEKVKSSPFSRIMSSFSSPSSASKRNSISTFNSTLQSVEENNTFVGKESKKSESIFNNNSSQNKNFNNSTDNDDVVYNLIDNYACILCCAFIHSGIIDALCFLGTRGKTDIAIKSKNLLIEILIITARILPERQCAELLMTDSLINLASFSSEKILVTRAYKASCILELFANTFSPSHIVGGPNYINSHEIGIDDMKPWENEETRRRQSTVNSMNTSHSTKGTTINGDTNSQSGYKAHYASIKSIKDIAGELKSCSKNKMIIFNQDYINNIAETQNLRASLNNVGISNQSPIIIDAYLEELHRSLVNVVDKNEFNRQMEASKVIGKEGKEPFRWDWDILSEMLEHSFQHPDRLNDCLQTKWIRRLSGFYRCASEEKGYFANLEWEPCNLQYLDCAFNLYQVLVTDSNGVNFLGGDRRGMLFNEMARELENLINNPAQSVVGGGGIGGSPIASESKNVFRLTSCNQTMAREYFILLGRMTKLEAGRKLLDSTKVFQHLSLIGSNHTLDYLSRLSLTSLALTDDGFISRHLLQIWTTSGDCSFELRQYSHSILRVILLSRPADFYRWGIDCMLNQITFEDNHQDTLLALLEEAMENKFFLKKIILTIRSKHLSISIFDNIQKILYRFLSQSEGIEYLQSSKSLDPILEHWKTKGCLEYSQQIERSLALVLKEPYKSKKKPIPIAEPIKIPILDKNSNSSNIGSISGNFANDDDSDTTSDSEKMNLEGLVRLPWKIEVRVNAQQSGFTRENTPSEYLKIDSFIDITDFESNSSSVNQTTDKERILKVRGIVLDNKGLPCGYPIATNRIVTNSLLVGISPVKRDGTIVKVNSDGSNKGNKYIPLSSGVTTTMNNARDSVSGFRESLSAAHPDLDSTNTSERESPINFRNEKEFDWSSCTPGHRQGAIKDFGNGLFSVEILDEPCIWIFSRAQITENKVNRISKYSANNPKSTASNRKRSGSTEQQPNPSYRTSMSGGFVYLVEIQYLLQFETGQPMFVPMPRHSYGELAKNIKGCEILQKQNIIPNLLKTAYDDSLQKNIRTSSLWALGNIAASELGFIELNQLDLDFVEWCIKNALTSPNYTFRGIFFYILGLISRSPSGSLKLRQLQWYGSPSITSAVALPKNFSQLFQNTSYDGDTVDNISDTANQIFSSGSVLLPHAVETQDLTPIIATHGSTPKDIEKEILNNIVKLPGMLCYSESKTKLDSLKISYPELFQKRSLYVAVQHILESYSFKINARRDINKLFSSSARCKNNHQILSTSP